MLEFEAKLGDVRFQARLISFDTSQRTSAATWPEVARVGRAPALQFTGHAAETIQLSGTIYPAYHGGIGHIAKLRDMLKRGEPYDWYYADTQLAEYLGKWVIEKLGETRTFLLGNGIPQKQTFTLDLKQYGEDAP